MPRAIKIGTTTKTEHGVPGYRPRDYAYVPDPFHPSTWKLRLYAQPGDSKPSVRLTAYARAALGPQGWRGHRADVPRKDRARVTARVDKAWREARLERVHHAADKRAATRAARALLADRGRGRR